MGWRGLSLWRAHFFQADDTCIHPRTREGIHCTATPDEQTNMAGEVNKRENPCPPGKVVTKVKNKPYSLLPFVFLSSLFLFRNHTKPSENILRWKNQFFACMVRIPQQQVLRISGISSRPFEKENLVPYIFSSLCNTSIRKYYLQTLLHSYIYR